MSSQRSSHKGSPFPDSTEETIDASQREDGLPPAKRRKVAEAKDRTTQYLDLRPEEEQEDAQVQLDKLLKVLHKKRKIVVIAGAGISVSAGSKL